MNQDIPGPERRFVASKIIFAKADFLRHEGFVVENNDGEILNPIVSAILNPDMILGIHDTIEESVYHGIPAVSKHGLDNFKRSPLHFFTGLAGIHSEPTPAQVFGRLAHMAVLEQERFRQVIAVGPDVAKNTNRWKEFAEENPGKELIKQAEAEKLEQMILAILRKSTASNLIRNGKTERSVLGIDEETRLPIKGRADFDALNDNYLLDYKTTVDASFESFQGDATRYGYHRQAAWYCDLFTAAGRPKEHFIILAQEKEPPFECAIYVYEAAELELGRKQCRNRIRKLKKCLDEKRWTEGYPDQILSLGLTSYEWEKEE